MIKEHKAPDDLMKHYVQPEVESADSYPSEIMNSISIGIYRGFIENDKNYCYRNDVIYLQLVLIDLLRR